MKHVLLSTVGLLALAAATPAFAQSAALADTGAGAYVDGHCAKVAAPNKIQDAGFSCASPTGAGPVVLQTAPSIVAPSLSAPNGAVLTIGNAAVGSGIDINSSPITPVAGGSSYGLNINNSVTYPLGTTANPIVEGLVSSLSVNGSGSVTSGDLLSGYVLTRYNHTGTIDNSNVFESSSYVTSSGTINANHAYFNNFNILGTGTVGEFDAYTAGITGNNGTIGLYTVFGCHNGDMGTAPVSKFCLYNTDPGKAISTRGALLLNSGALLPSISSGQAYAYADATNGATLAGLGSTFDVDLGTPAASVLMIPHGTQQIAGRIGSAAAPTFTEFSDKNTGIYFDEAHGILFSSNGSNIAKLNTSGIMGASAAGWALRNLGATATAPTFVPHQGDTKAGIGADVAGDVSVIVDNAGTATEMGRWSSAGLKVNGPTTVTPVSVNYTIGAGGNYPTVSAAMAVLNPMLMVTGSSATLTLLDGVTTETSPVYVGTPFGKAITITSQHTYTHNLLSIQSVSGTVGNWSYVENLDSVSGIAVGDYLTTYGTTGGTNPSYVAGVWPVTAVDAVNNRVTVTTTGQQTATPSGAVTGTVVDYKGTLKFTNSDGIRVWDGATGINLVNFNLVGDGTSHIGLSNQDLGRVNVGSLSVYGFGFTNVLALYNAEINTAGYLVSSGGGGWGVLAQNGGTIDSPYIIATGNAGKGVQASIDSSVTSGHDMTASGNGSTGIIGTQGGVVVVSGNVTTTGNVGSGYSTGSGGYLNFQSTVTSANNTVADQAYYYAPAGAVMVGPSAIGFTAPCTNMELCVNGNGQFVGTSLQLRNTTPSLSGARMFLDSDGFAQNQFRDGSGNAKWEWGHTGSASSYQLRLYNDTLGAMAMTVDAATSNVAFAAPVKPGSVAVGATNACSVAGQRAWITDASVAYSASTRGAQITGAGANGAPGYCDGAHWDYE